MKILVTGSAGFIGFHLCISLINNHHNVVGLDNINNYYDQNLKFDRLQELGIEKAQAEVRNVKIESKFHGPRFKFIRTSLEDKESLSKLFQDEKFDVVCNLAAQAGVRYSIQNPMAYIESNVVGFLNILECCRDFQIQHLVYASSSSVYGLNKKVPFETNDQVDKPISLYAATKKSNELMAHTYSHLFKFPTTGLRFFTVYGPWGRPDMAMFLFTSAIVNNKPIKIFNYGEMERDFTFIDDVVEGLVNVIEGNIKHRINSNELYKIYNIGNNKSIKLMEFVEAIERSLGKKGIYNFLEMQPGDVEKTWANVDNLISDFGYKPNTPVERGVDLFVGWYKKYYEIK